MGGEQNDVDGSKQKEVGCNCRPNRGGEQRGMGARGEEAGQRGMGVNINGDRYKIT